MLKKALIAGLGVPCGDDPVFPFEIVESDNSAALEKPEREYRIFKHFNRAMASIDIDKIEGVRQGRIAANRGKARFPNGLSPATARRGCFSGRTVVPPRRCSRFPPGDALRCFQAARPLRGLRNSRFRGYWHGVSARCARYLLKCFSLPQNQSVVKLNLSGAF